MKKVSISKQTALNEIAPLFGLKPKYGAILFNLFCNSDAYIDEKCEGLTSTVLEKLEFDFVDYEYISYWREKQYTLLGRGKQFIQAVHARIETRLMLKHGCDLFPELANVPELAAIN